METEQKARIAKSHAPLPKEDDNAYGDISGVDRAVGYDDDVWLSSVPENLRTIQYEVSDADHR
jgi:hypothetical protein